MLESAPARTNAFRIAEIRPQVSGVILQRMFEEGSDVREGQQLYQIDPSLYQAALDGRKARSRNSRPRSSPPRPRPPLQIAEPHQRREPAGL